LYLCGLQLPRQMWLSSALQLATSQVQLTFAVQAVQLPQPQRHCTSRISVVRRANP
jgi:hypothetical protein